MRDYVAEGYEQWEEGYVEGDDGTMEETYLLDPDEGFTDEDLLFAENAFAPHMMGRPAPRDGLEEPDLPGEEVASDEPTTDPYAAIDEGRIYYPPEDPPILPSERLRDADVATGFATSADDAPLEVEDVPERFEGSDYDIAERVAEALRLHASTSDLSVRVQVQDGVVTLRGRVGTLQDVALAEDIASEVEGVIEVREQLTVG
ncbi:MAG: BON domain-containing protein [Anaerolineae bacterium]|nr:BON domain-containing protein [Anaerolineae bacterium]